MSNEPDYNFNSPSSSASTSDAASLQLPFALLAAAIAILLVAQTITAFKTKSALNEGKTQLSSAATNMQPAMQQGADVEKKLTAIVEDLLILAKTDDDAKAIVGKYGIQFSGKGGVEAGPPAAPEPPK
jgi:hypothetical protein